MNHGNACAGVIAATMNNNQGIAGIASNCRIMPIRIFNSYGFSIPPNGIADAIMFAVDSGADILSNSWGINSNNPNEEPVIVTAINYAVNNDCVVVFAAGNNARHYSCDDDGYVTFPANVNISGVVTVGASDRNDNQADYSPTSSLIDIVAPSHRAYPPAAYSPQCGGISGETFEMWSIDIPGNTGYNPWPADGTHPPTTGEILPNNLAYTARFGGTSHSCPVVAGVAALMLSANPNLSYTEVYNILISSTDRVGGYTYIHGKCNEMGYGRVNAYAAVRAALPGISGPSNLCSSGATYSVPDARPGVYVRWDYSSNIESYYGGNTWIALRATGNGEGWVEAHVPVPGGDTLYLPRMTVWAGIPAMYSFYTGVNGEEVKYYEVAEICPGTINCFDAEPEVEEMDVIAEDYTWHLPQGFTVWGPNGNGLCFDAHGTIGSPITGDVTNACGTGYGVIQIYLADNGCRGAYRYTISPNPVSTVLTVERLTVEEAAGRAVLEPVEVYGVPEKGAADKAYTVEIWHEKKGKVMAFESKNKRGAIDVSGLEKGHYILHIRTQCPFQKSRPASNRERFLKKSLGEIAKTSARQKSALNIN
jgi:hypothetical protein